MDPLRIPFDLRDLIVFLTCIFAAFGTGIFGVVRGHNGAGALAALGFLLLSLEGPADLIVFRFWMNAAPEADTAIFNWTYACVSSLAIFLGVCLLVSALMLVMKASKQEYR